MVIFLSVSKVFLIMEARNTVEMWKCFSVSENVLVLYETAGYEYEREISDRQWSVVRSEVTLAPSCSETER